jgi:chemotaxis protein CheD
MDHVVGIGGFAVSATPGDVIKTFALATCVGIVMYSASKRVMGMSHIQLPSSSVMRQGDLPSRFADLGPAHLLMEMQRKGVSKGEIMVSLYGGIQRNGPDDMFRIGEKNLEVIRDGLTKMGMRYTNADVSGTDSRTLVAQVTSGMVEVVKRPMARPNLAYTRGSSSRML